MQFAAVKVKPRLDEVRDGKTGKRAPEAVDGLWIAAMGRAIAEDADVVTYATYESPTSKTARWQVLSISGSELWVIRAEANEQLWSSGVKADPSSIEAKLYRSRDVKSVTLTQAAAITGGNTYYTVHSNWTVVMQDDMLVAIAPDLGSDDQTDAAEKFVDALRGWLAS